MKVLLTKDVYKLGRAGDIKKVADGYGRNFLIPQGLAVIATPSALSRAENIRTQANAKRTALNNELSGVAEILAGLTLTFPAKAGETGKLYGSITPANIAEAIKEKTGLEINRRQLDFEPIRTLGTRQVHIRLTVDLIPEVTVIIHREGEAVSLEEAVSPEETVEPVEMDMDAQVPEEAIQPNDQDEPLETEVQGDAPKAETETA
jgi:large subunit ribosomal protein L9